MLKAPINAHAPELIKSPVDGLDVEIEKVNTPTPTVSANRAVISVDNSRIFLHNPGTVSVYPRPLQAAAAPPMIPAIVAVAATIANGPAGPVTGAEIIPAAPPAIAPIDVRAPAAQLAAPRS